MFNSHQFWTLVLFCGVYVAWGLTDSIQAPFYPIEASSKGATPSEYGLVFGVIHLAIFVSGPIFGKYMHVFGVRKVYFFGVISTSVCAVSFGFLDFIEDKATFLGLSYALRVAEGIAEAASWSAVFAMLLHMFPKNVATIYAMTEASFSFAEMVGPTFGALLYNVGGFALPFEVCGGLCFFTALLTLFVLPKDKNDDQEALLRGRSKSVSSSSSQSSISINNNSNSKKKTKKKFSFVKFEDESTLPNESILIGAPVPEFTYNTPPQPSAPVKRNETYWNNASQYEVTYNDLPRHPTSRAFSVSSAASVVSETRRRNRMNQLDDIPHKTAELWPILSNPKVILALCGTVYGASCQGFLEATLEPFLSEQFGLSVTKVGLTFLGLSVPYFFASTTWGYVCDHWASPVYIQPIGSLFTILGLLILGPASYIPKLDWIELPNHYVSILGLGLMGVGTAALLVASFTGAQKAAMENQQVNPDDAYSVISGIWTSSFALGNFIGPSLGGFLVEMLGFAQTTVVFQLIGVFMLILDVITLSCFPPRNLGSKLHLKRIDPNNVRVDLYERLP